jgi:Class II flagellar assembly regulator
MLSGSDDPAGLQHLADLAATVSHAGDPRLAALVSAIVLRVRVELARRQIRPSAE